MPDAGLLKLAVAMGRDPAELNGEGESWSAYWVNRLFIFVNARGIAER
jgi:hypothetical protein